MTRWLATLLTAAMASLTPAMSMAQGKVVIAHRGASGYLPEHSQAGKAMASGGKRGKTCRCSGGMLAVTFSSGHRSF